MQRGIHPSIFLFSLLVLSVAAPDMGEARSRTRHPRKATEIKKQAKKMKISKPRKVKQVKNKQKKVRIRRAERLRAKIPKGRPNYYVMRKKDTLRSVAKKFYGDPKSWTFIFDKNEDLITDPAVLDLTGQKLVLP